MKKLTLIVSLSVILLTGCFWGVEKKEPITKGWSPKTFFYKAKEESSTEVSIKLFEQLQAAYPSSKYALQAKLEIAYILYKNRNYNQSIEHLNNYIKLYPNHFSTPYAYYLRAIASENKSSSILEGYLTYLTDSAQRDISSVKNSFNYYLALIDKFPKTKYAEEAKTRLIIIRNILSRHELFVAIYYTKKGANIAAINRSKYIIQNYPNTPSVPAALHLMAHNYDIINTTDLAKDTRRVLKNSYYLYTPHYSLEN